MSPIKESPVIAFGPYLGSPKFSPDGEAVAFVAGPGFLSGDIYLAPLSGGDRRPLTFDKRWIQGLSWTPDSKEIIFSSDRGGLFSLWRVLVSGGSPELVSGVGKDAFQPSVSRRAHRLTYLRERVTVNAWRTVGPSRTGQCGAPTNLISSTRKQIDMDASPDGKRIAFASGRTGR